MRPLLVFLGLLVFTLGCPFLNGQMSDADLEDYIAKHGEDGFHNHAMDESPVEDDTNGEDWTEEEYTAMLEKLAKLDPATLEKLRAALESGDFDDEDLTSFLETGFSEGDQVDEIEAPEDLAQEDATAAAAAA
eukprot:gnl/Hemi2/23513_TR7880_c0_g9_i1.p1 gnl/Hemi2/23513_TR7880_c0_g9~~gnl/Hemi2/23513_TR7880_c0_g9_i1.p1  ORF type:complete len:155 (-),score=66.88 gnl/Hemi2/23513_TR7880_c0_g9_i1:101-499(-)